MGDTCDAVLALLRGALDRYERATAVAEKALISKGFFSKDYATARLQAEDAAKVLACRAYQVLDHEP